MAEVCRKVETFGSFLRQCLPDQEVPFGMGNLLQSTQNWVILGDSLMCSGSRFESALLPAPSLWCLSS